MSQQEETSRRAAVISYGPNGASGECRLCDARWNGDRGGEIHEDDCPLAPQAVQQEENEPRPSRRVASCTTVDEQRVWASAFAASMLEWMSAGSEANDRLAAAGTAAMETANAALEGLRRAAAVRPELLPKWLGVSAPTESEEQC